MGSNFQEPTGKLNTENYKFPSSSDEKSSGSFRGNSRAKNVSGIGDIQSRGAVSRRPDVRQKVDKNVDEEFMNERQTVRKKRSRYKQEGQNVQKSKNNRSMSPDTISITSVITIGAVPANLETSSITGKRSVKSMFVPNMGVLKGVRKSIKSKLLPKKQKSEEPNLTEISQDVFITQNTSRGLRSSDSFHCREGTFTQSSGSFHNVQKDSETSETDDGMPISSKRGIQSSGSRSRGEVRRSTKRIEAKRPNYCVLWSLFKEVANLGSGKWKKLVEYLMHGLPAAYIEEEIQYLSVKHKGDAKMKLEAFLIRWHEQFSTSEQRVDIECVLKKALQDVLQKPRLVLKACTKEKAETEGVLELHYLDCLLRGADFKRPEYHIICQELGVTRDDEEMIVSKRGSGDVSQCVCRVVKLYKDRNDKITSDHLLKGPLLRAFKAAGRPDIMDKLCGNKAVH